MQERLAIVGSGTIACGLAAVAGAHGDVVLSARSERSADRARKAVAKCCERIPELAHAYSRVRIVTTLEAIADTSFVIEAIAEDVDCKAPLLAQLGEMTGPEVVLATTTSSLSISELARASRHPERFAGLHVFNPVPRMELVELVFDAAASAEVRRRTQSLCIALGKTPIQVPDTPGFVVNRLLFPFLFDAVRLTERAGIDPSNVDTCITLGTGMPMGPIALLDFIGLDVSLAIGESIGVEVPGRLRELVASGALGRKTSRGFYAYD